MTQDAKFSDGIEHALNLGAQAPEDIDVLSALLQDAIFSSADITWRPKERRFAILLNRFRWEAKEAIFAQGHDPERVRSVFVIDDVMGVASSGIDRTPQTNKEETLFSVLRLEHTQTDQDHIFTLILSGDGAIRFRAEAIELVLRDVTLPYSAPSGKVPDHDLDT